MSDWTIDAGDRDQSLVASLVDTTQYKISETTDADSELR